VNERGRQCGQNNGPNNGSLDSTCEHNGFK